MSLFRRPGLGRLSPTQSARGMRTLATAMLAGMAAVFIAATRLDHLHPAWGFVRAFAEAGLVGGIADWFAVTALFRRPLGLPIPHTAIIPRNKDRIGDALASFLKDNFLTASVVARRMKKVDVAGAVGRFLATPGEGRLREGGSRLLADILEALDQEKLGGMVKAAVAERMRRIDIAPLLGQTLEAAITEERHVPLVDGIVTWAGRTLDANEDMIRAMVHQRAGWILKLAGLDARLADAIVDGLRKLTIDMALDPHHPLRAKAEEGLARLASGLRSDPELQARVEAWKNETIENEAVGDWLGGVWEMGRAGLLKGARDPDAALAGVWEKSRAGLLKGARDPNAALAGKFGEALRQLGETLQQEPRLKAAINQFARRATVGVVASYGDGIVTLVSDTVRAWDARTVSDRLEGAVGRDLQYIRINGTLVGGLVGLAIHSVEMLT
jgi:uncharacterized membrane-anchored protein YjiN (DUF445 family)